MGKYCNKKGAWGIGMCLNEPGIVPDLHTFTSISSLDLLITMQDLFSSFYK